MNKGFEYTQIVKTYAKKEFDDAELILYKSADKDCPYTVHWVGQYHSFRTMNEARKYYENFGK